jgi:hypothetical protein
VPSTPAGTDTRNTSRHEIGPRIPPSTRPMNAPAIAATALIPSASPRSSCGKASVMIAEELPIRSAPPTPWPIRIAIIHLAAAVPWSQVSDSRIEHTVKMAKPMLNILTRP